MKKTLLFILIMLLSKVSFSQSEQSQFDQVLADSLGADPYGMKYYILVILKTGTNTTESEASTDSLFAGHMSNIGRLAKEGKLVVAGPIKKNPKLYRGIFILLRRRPSSLLRRYPAFAAGETASAELARRREPSFTLAK
ncbi:MAG: hypothetical protein ABI763_07695 [Bacteroidota bacterium]